MRRIFHLRNHFAFSLLFFILIGLAAPGAKALASSAPKERKTDLTSTVALADLLDAGGALSLPAGRSGSIDLSGWRLAGELHGAPRFIQTASPNDVVPPSGAPGNENWVGSSVLGDIGGASPTVHALAFDASGNLYVGGNFTSAGGISANYIARWNGSSWSALGSGMNNVVLALAVDGSGNLYAGGVFSQAGGSFAQRIARWNGVAWSALGSGVNSDVYSLAIDNAGNLYAGGYFTQAGGAPASYVARWNGSAWSALGSGLNYHVSALICDSSNNLYVGGWFTQAGGAAANYIARWNGAAWNTLGSGTDNYVAALAFDGSGNLYAAGGFTTAGGVSASRVARWNGATWSSLGSGVDASVRALAVDSSGNLYAGGSFTQAGGSPASRIARWNGSSWNAMGSGVNNLAYAMAVNARGNLFTGGSFTQAGGLAAGRIARWTAAVGQCNLAAGNDYTFYTANMPVTIHIDTLGTLDCISMQRYNRHHPQAEAYQQTGYYWRIEGVDTSNAPAADFVVNLTLPYAGADANDKVCRYDSDYTDWYCGANSFVTNTSVTVTGVNGFSDWAIGHNGPTAVTLAGFSVQPAIGGVRLEWQTVQEMGFLGFNLYRSLNPQDDPRLLAPLNPTLIPPSALGKSHGAAYTFLDTSAAPGIAFSYWLGIVYQGSVEFFGPRTTAAWFDLFLPALRR